jgi:hypothetical protein
MRALTLPLLTATLFAAASTLPAQDTKPKTKTPAPDRVVIEKDQPGADVQIFARGGAWSSARSMIGVSTSSTGERDTLGLLVTSITPNGPAEKAGIVEGNRIAAINGVNLRLAAADAGQDDMNGITARRLTRELGKIDPGTNVELRLYADGQWKTVKVKTVAPDSLRPVRIRVGNSDDRAVLGFELNSTGSKRDTLGVLIAAVHEDGPAEKAGLIEGDRVAAVNGTDLRVRHDDAGDDWVSGAMVTRFQRVMRAAKPGDKVELRVWSGGQSKTVQVTAAKASELYKDQTRRIRIGAGAPMIWGMDGDQAFPSIAPMPPMPPMAPMPGFYTPRARVQSFDMDDDDDLEDDLVHLRRDAEGSADAADAAVEAARKAAVDAARVAPGARSKRSSESIRAERTRAAQRALMSSAASSFGGTPAIAASWDMLATGTANSETGAKRINIPGLSVASVTPELAEYLGKGSKDGYLVLESGGQWSALRAGDVLLSVDGNCVNDGGITTSNNAHEVVVLRKGKKLTLRLAGG